MANIEPFRSYTIRLSPDAAAMAEGLAAREERSMDELLGEALRVYESAQRRRQMLDSFSDESMLRNPQYSEADVPRLIAEVREEERAQTR